MDDKSEKNGFWTFVKFIGLSISISPFLFILYQFLSDENLVRDAKTNPGLLFVIVMVVGVTLAVMALGIVIFNVARLYERK